MADATVDAARTEILRRVRSALAGAPGAAPRRGEAPQLTVREPLQQRLARFEEVLSRVGGHVHRVRDERAAAQTLARLVDEIDARDVALSDDALVRALAARLPSGARCFDGWSDRERLFACGLGLTSAQAAIAETGTLVLESRAERHRLVSLVPPVHVAVLRAGSVRSGLDEVLAELAGSGGPCPAVTLITGPSRTADIELELVVGVHGPRALHVIVLEEPSE